MEMGDRNWAAWRWESGSCGRIVASVVILGRLGITVWITSLKVAGVQVLG